MIRTISTLVRLYMYLSVRELTNHYLVHIDGLDATIGY